MLLYISECIIPLHKRLHDLCITYKLIIKKSFMKRLLPFLIFMCFILVSGHTQLSLVDGTDSYTITFDNTQTSVNQGTFNGSGLAPSPSSGQLDGDAWAISGMSSGTHSFGNTSIDNDFARGISSGGSGTGGLYAFQVSSNNYAMGIQPTGSDWTPGGICLKVDNNKSTAISDVTIQYNILVYNDQNRANSFNFSYSTDGVNFTTVPSASYTSTAGGSSNASWATIPVTVDLTGINLAAGQSIVLKWDGNDVSGSGSRDEFALDDISVSTTSSTNNCTEPSSQPSNLSFSGQTNNAINGTFQGTAADQYLVIQSTSSSFSGTITDGTSYAAGQVIGNGIVVSYSTATSFTSTGLDPLTTYYFTIYSVNSNCVGGPDYNTTNPLTGSASTTDDPNSDYYSVVNGQTCEQLKTVLYNLIDDHTVYSYNALWSIYNTTDDRINDSGNETIVWDMYSDNPTGSENEFTFGAEQCGSYSTEGDCYNREHSFPRSWWGGSTSVPQYSDVFMVIPADGWINGLRSNNPYGEVAAGGAIQTTNNGSKLGSSAISIPGYTGNVFEPRDEFKGDLARIYFYMVTRYENNIASWENTTTEADAVLDGTTFPSMEQWAIDMFIDWHNNDPVSAKEIERNDEIFALQNNRNPFVDHPEYVDLIWGSCGAPDTEAPTTPTSLVGTNVTSSSVVLNWNASSDNVAVTGYNIFQDGAQVASTNSTNYTVTNLTDATSYSFYVQAYDAAGNTSNNSNTISITTDSSTDTEAPTVPTNLTVSNVTETTCDLNWTASSDNIGVTGYTIYQDGAAIATSSTASYDVTNLNPSTTYLFNVEAYDAAGNTSGLSSTISVTTQSAADTQAPTVPTNLAVANVTETTCDLSWTASSDNIGVTGYTIYQDGAAIATSSTASYDVANLTAATTYLFNVEAYDAAGNTSGLSSTISVTTSGSSGGDIILHEGYFESGWDNWQDGGSDCSRYSGSRSSEGSFSIRLRDNSGTSSSMTSETFDVTSYSTLKIDFSYYVNSFENVENFFLRYYNGSSWITIKDYVRGTDFNNGEYKTGSVTIDNGTYNFPSNARFRFQADASGNNDQVYIDAVIITADPSNNSLITDDYLAEAEKYEVINDDDELNKTTDRVLPTLQVYPNPTVDVVNLKFTDGNSKVTRIDVLNAIGMPVTQLNGQDTSVYQLDLSEMKAGVYFVVCSFENGGQLTKTIIKH